MIGAALSATAVDLTTMLRADEVRDTLAAALARNVSLVRDVSDQAPGRIADIVFRALKARMLAPELK